MPDPRKDQSKLPDEEIAKRRDDILRRMHKLPPKSQKDYAGESKKKATGKSEEVPKRK